MFLPQAIKFNVIAFVALSVIAFNERYMRNKILLFNAALNNAITHKEDSCSI